MPHRIDLIMIICANFYSCVCLCVRLTVVHQRSGLSQWEKQIVRPGVPATGRSDSIPAGFNPLLPASGGGAGTRGETDQAALSTQPTEPLPRRGVCLCLFESHHP